MLQKAIKRRLVDETEAISEEQMCLDLRERTAGNREVMKKLAGTGASLSLGDVCHYRDGCPPHLRSQAELFLRWPIACHIVDALSQIHCSLPSDKVTKALNGHR